MPGPPGGGPAGAFSSPIDPIFSILGPEAARELSRFIESQPSVYEAHSTDYQPPAALQIFRHAPRRIGRRRVDGEGERRADLLVRGVVGRGEPAGHLAAAREFCPDGLAKIVA